MKHIHCELIKAWADGKEIEVYHCGKKEWQSCPNPFWTDKCQYRIKPEEPDYGKIALNGYKSEPSWITQTPTDCWKNSANAVIEAYKKHHNLP